MTTRGAGIRTIACFLIACLISGMAMAHPPKSLEVKFDKTKKTLDVTVKHSVSDTEKHYVKELKVEVNGKEVITQKTSKQESDDEQTYTYKLTDVKKGDKIKAVANCNKYGKKSKEITVE
ncbi:MAG: hypothetical protein GY851_15965 [bacterium]|nr:hypothetical protein [bacterium]